LSLLKTFLHSNMKLKKRKGHFHIQTLKMQHVLHMVQCFTWFSKVCLRVLPGVGSSSMLCAFCITSITSSLAFLIAFWISRYVCGSAMVSPIPIEWPAMQYNKSTLVVYNNKCSFWPGEHKNTSVSWNLGNPGFQPLLHEAVTKFMSSLLQFILIFHFINLVCSWKYNINSSVFKGLQNNTSKAVLPLKIKIYKTILLSVVS